MSTPPFIGKQKWSKDPKVRKFVIVGCGRSGTLYMTKVFDILGFDVGHEGIHRNGTSSWYIVEKKHAQYIKKIFAGHNVTYIHLIRNPLDVITSMWHCEHLKNRMALDFVRKYCENLPLEYDLEAVVKWWIYWNHQVTTNFKINFTLPVEQLQYPDAFYEFCQLIKVKYKSKKFHKVKELGMKTHTIRGLMKNSLKKTYGKDFLNRLTIQDIEDECGGEWTKLLKSYAEKYGYRL